MYVTRRLVELQLEFSEAPPINISCAGRTGMRCMILFLLHTSVVSLICDHRCFEFFSDTCSLILPKFPGKTFLGYQHDHGDNAKAKACICTTTQQSRSTIQRPLP